MTESPGWASGGWNTQHGGGRDGYVVALTPSGAHRWSTYLGGTDRDFAGSVTTDASGNVYVAGYTDSRGWVSGGWDTLHGGYTDAFVVSLTPSGAHRWSTYLGGTRYDFALGIITDVAGNVYAAGDTGSSGWVSGGWDVEYGGADDAFIVSLTAGGAHRWSTYFGGSGWDGARDITADHSGSLYVAGGTYSPDWISRGWDTTYGGNEDGFVIKVNLESTPTADLNSDGHVDSADLDLVRMNWQTSVSPGDLLHGDASGDGTVGSADLDIIRANWGVGAAAAAARTETEESTPVSAPTFIGPRRAPVSDAAFSSWRNSDPEGTLSDLDLATLAEAAWLREMDGLRNKTERRDATRIVLSESKMVFGGAGR